MFDHHALLRLATLTPVVKVGNPDANADAIIEGLGLCAEADIVLTPELCVSGYTCGDLFGQEWLLKKSWDAVLRIAEWGKEKLQLVVVGCPVKVEGALYNCAVLLNQGYVIGVVPKSYLPNYKEFYEARWFKEADGSHPAHAILYLGEFEPARPVPFGTDLLFRCENVVVGVEVCEDVWVPLPPSSYHAVAGANVLLNLSASNETVGKSEYRRKLIEQQSARCIAAYAYCSSGPTESTSDLVFGGHNLIYENGSKLAEADKFNRKAHSEVVDIDIERLNNERAKNTAFGACRRMLPCRYRVEDFYLKSDLTILNSPLRPVYANVFIPAKTHELEDRCKEIFGIQTCALAKRLESMGPNKTTVVIGVSGGLDSTLALLVACKTMDMLGYARDNICGVTMPGFGTTPGTLKNAVKLMELLRVWQETIDIRPLSIAAFDTLGHKPFGLEYDNGHPEKMLLDDFMTALKNLPPGSQDLVFENVQARLRTFLLMNKGFVLGTGDLSELALGWCTYNGDHMSMYNVNCSVPKTLVRFLVRWIAENQHQQLCPLKTETEVKDQSFWTAGELQKCLFDICDTAISPELLPGPQETEKSIGPYELTDFFLFHLLRHGYGPEKIVWLAENATGFARKYTHNEIKGWLRLFLRRFFAAQYKRNCVPDGPKVGSVALSPRGDWRMPSDADPSIWTAWDKKPDPNNCVAEG